MLTKEDIELLSSESLSDLEDLANNLGPGYRNIEDMLRDNPGMVSAIYDFVLANLSSYDIEDE